MTVNPFEAGTTEYEEWERQETASQVTGWPETTLLPSPRNPMATARRILENSGLAGRVAWWRGDWYQWAETHWAVWPEAAVTRWLYGQTEHATYTDGDGNIRPWSPTRSRIADLRDALALGVVQRDASAEPDDDPGHIPCRNGVLDVATSELIPHTPHRFRLHALDVDWTADASCPLWTAFLAETFEHDTERVSLLQEWFGYVLLGGTSLQKIMYLYGPRRSGKGTILRVLRTLVGERYVASPPSLDSLAGPFGLEPLLGRRLALLGDVQWHGAHTSEVVGILLGISGEDSVDVARKHRVSWSGTLPIRFTIAGNDRPRFSNTSGALVSRLLLLHFRVSAYGREDSGLTVRLLAEQAGILRWALDGWRRLQERGRFTEPAEARREAREIERHASPVGAFLEDRCVLEGQISLDDLYTEYRRWRHQEGLSEPTGLPTFSRDLQSVAASLAVVRRGPRGGRSRMVVGVRLSTEEEGESVPGVPESYPVYPGTGDDHDDYIFAGQLELVPGVPGVPGRIPESSSQNETSSERMRFGESRTTEREVAGYTRVPAVEKASSPAKTAGTRQMAYPGTMPGTQPSAGDLAWAHAAYDRE